MSADMSSEELFSGKDNEKYDLQQKLWNVKGIVDEQEQPSGHDWSKTYEMENLVGSDADKMYTDFKNELARSLASDSPQGGEYETSSEEGNPGTVKRNIAEMYKSIKGDSKKEGHAIVDIRQELQ